MHTLLRFCLICCLLFLVACNPSVNIADKESSLPLQLDPISTLSHESRGAIVYAQTCASCHGANLEGQADWQAQNEDGTWRAPPHDETGHTWHHDDAYILDRVINGTENLDPNMQAISNMPAYKDTLSEADIIAVVEFIKQSWSEEIQIMRAERSGQ